MVVNILHDKTFWFFGSHFLGGRCGRPLLFEREIRSARRALARLAVLQDEVRRLRLSNSVSFLASPDKKNFCFLFWRGIIKVRQTTKRLF